MSTLHEESGIIHHIGEIESFGTKGFQKRQIVLMVDPEKKFPETVPFSLTKDKMALADDFELGQHVTVKFFVGGRHWQEGDKYFPDLKAWAIQGAGDDETNAHPPHEPEPGPEQDQAGAEETEEGEGIDALPF